MKKLSFVLSFSLFFVLSCFAQSTPAVSPIDAPQKGGKMSGKGHKDHAMKELNLSAEQKVQMKDIKNTFKGKMMAIRSDAALSKEQKHAKVKEVMDLHEGQVKTVLTPQQFTKLTEIKAKHRENRMSHKGKGKNHKDKN